MTAAILTETTLDLPLYARGKVRDIYDLGDKLLIIATDRISAFDVVLPNGIPDKGYVLSRMSKFWFEMTKHIVPNHFVGLADDPESLGALADHPRIKTLPPEIARQAMVVKRAERVDVECVVRAYLTGSGLVDYQATGTIFGIKVPEGLVDGSKLPELLFTPTTKAETGHDEPMSMAEVAGIAGAELAERLREQSFAVFRRAHEYAAERGIIIADTKFEFGMRDGELILIDEVLTPDSARFWPAAEYEPGRSQPSLDKQPVRDYLEALRSDGRWSGEPPAPALPAKVVTATEERYVEAYLRLTGRELPSFEVS